MKIIEFFGVKYFVVEYKRHPKGGGIIASTAKVAEDVYVGPEAMVLENAFVCEGAVLDGKTVIKGHALIEGGYYKDETINRTIQKCWPRRCP